MDDRMKWGEEYFWKNIFISLIWKYREKLNKKYFEVWNDVQGRERFMWSNR